MGDLIISLSFLNALKKIHKNSKIDLLVNENLFDLAKHFPYVSNLIKSQTQHGKLSLLYRIRLGLQLRKNHYTDCYILTNSFKSSIVPFMAKIKNRISYLGEFRYGLVNKIVKSIDRKEGMANKYLNLIDHTYKTEYKPKIMSKAIVQQYNTKYSFKGEYIVLCPDAEFGPAKRWPLNKWIDLAMCIQEKYQVVFIGLDTAMRVRSKELLSNNCIDLIGKTSLDDVVKIISQSACVVANDSGLMHMAAALDRPVVGIYGSSSPKYTPPLQDDDKRALIYENLSCSPCFKRECPLEHMNCLNNISVEHVKDSILRLVK